MAIDMTASHLDLGEQRVKLHLFDTAGQERFAGMCAQYYRRAEGLYRLATDIVLKKLQSYKVTKSS